MDDYEEVEVGDQLDFGDAFEGEIDETEVSETDKEWGV